MQSVVGVYKWVEWHFLYVSSWCGIYLHTTGYAAAAKQLNLHWKVAGKGTLPSGCDGLGIRLYCFLGPIHTIMSIFITSKFYWGYVIQFWAALPTHWRAGTILGSPEWWPVLQGSFLFFFRNGGGIIICENTCAWALESVLCTLINSQWLFKSEMV